MTRRARSALFNRISLDRARAKPVESEVGLSGGPFRHSENLARRRRTSERADATIQVEVGGDSTNQRARILQRVT